MEPAGLKSPLLIFDFNSQEPQPAGPKVFFTARKNRCGKLPGNIFDEAWKMHHLDREIKPTETRENLSGLVVELVNGLLASKSQTEQRGADFLQVMNWRTRESRLGKEKKHKL